MGFSFSRFGTRRKELAIAKNGVGTIPCFVEIHQAVDSSNRGWVLFAELRRQALIARK
jgi:hypothetical protein